MATNDKLPVTEANTYQSPQPRPGFIARRWPSLTFYTKLFWIVYKAGSKANWDRYDGTAWALSSEAVLRLLEQVGCRLDVSGLIGGHSGEDISLGRGNAIRLLAELLVTLWKKGYHMGIGRMDGGTGANVIPRSCTAYLAVRRSELGRFLRACEAEFSHLTTALRKVEKHIRFEAGAFPAPKKVWTEQTIRDVLETIRDERDRKSVV